MEEDELIQRAKEGDLDCFNQLVERYQREVYSLSLRMLGNASAAEDATQDAFFPLFGASASSGAAASGHGCFVLPPTPAETNFAHFAVAPLLP